MNQHNLTELLFHSKQIKVKLKKYVPRKTLPAEEKLPETILPPLPETESVKSPIAGVFYTSPSPQSPPFVKVGDIVEKENTLCIVEAMKVMNEIKAEMKCRIERVLVKNEEFVNIDQPLFAIIPL